MQIDLTQEEAELLRELLDQAHSNLREEVYKTEGTDWKRALKNRERVLGGLITKFHGV